MNFTELKALGDSRTKTYKDPIPEDQFITRYGWVFSYAKEDTVFSKHNILAISREDKKEFDHRAPLSEFPEIAEVFNIVPHVVSSEFFPNRGYTVMYWVK